MILVMAAAAAAMAGGSCVEALCDAEVLEPYFEKLGQARGARRPVHILQIGDSHTAGDAITGAWRDILQARYGGGGRGVLPPGRPYDGYLTRGVTVSMSSGWRVRGTFGSSWSSPHPPLGLSGFSLTSQSDGAMMGLVADPAQSFDRLVVCAIAERDAGTLTIRIGERSEHMRLASPTRRPECRTVNSDTPETTADVMAEGGPVTITSWATIRTGQGGVMLSNVGVVGSQLVHFARTDDSVIAEELRHYQPDLIVLAFGTNEGFAPRFSAFEYEIILRSQISRLRRLAGNVPILLLGAPDASTRRPELRNNAPAPTPAPCDIPAFSAPPAPPPPPPADTGGSNVIAAIMAELRGEPTPPPPPPAPRPSVAVSRPLFPPAALRAVRDVQRRIAAALHVAFWDWEARMGGRCAAVKWVRGAPPLMRGDYVHFNSAGGREIGSRLQADLDKASAGVGGN